MDPSPNTSFEAAPGPNHDGGPNNAVRGDGSAAPADAAISKVVMEVLYSDIGVNTLLNRLKQSIASARDFASFLQKRSKLEEDHAQGLKKLSKATHETITRADSRQGSYATQLEELTRFHERMGDNGMQFALSLHQMHEDLNELANNMERGRKHWKQTGLAAEKRAQDAEAAAEKAKSKYAALSDDYDRARTGDRTSGRMFGLKGPKSAAQHEEDLQRKTQAADADYASKVQTVQAVRQELLNSLRPQAVKAIQELIDECDSGLTLQLQKFATFNEKLLLANGMVVSPIDGPDNQGPKQRSLRELVAEIDNEKDLQRYLMGFHAKIPVRNQDLQYTPNKNTQKPTPAPPPAGAPTPAPHQNTYPQPHGHNPLNQHPPSAPQSPHSHPPPAQAFPPPQQPYQSYDNGYPQQVPVPHEFPSQGMTHQPPPPSQYPPYMPTPPPAVQSQAHGPGPHAGANLPPVKPVFGLSLEQLFMRDGTAVPMVVYQCIQAVDLFGLEVEGIYRLSGTASHINSLKALFDHDSSKVDFRHPEAFFHDVNSVAGLLKQFFRDLPDPLMTTEHYHGFIEAARIDNDEVRRDSIHAIINALPDPNYATLRALVLHLNRVQSHAQANRMSASNLAICFAPTIMGQHRGQVADAGLQARVVDTILQNTFQIFDED